MPRTALPPTPASSTDIIGKDGTKQLSSPQVAFELPEPAMISSLTTNRPSTSGNRNARMPESPISQASPSTLYPIQPSEAVKSRRRLSTAAANKESFALPPPPTRSRRIIQVKPVSEDQKKLVEPTSTGKGSGNTARKNGGTSAVNDAAAAGSSKKKQPSPTSAAGRKMARKTAHSLIERRRRSKINEEFAVLKDMIPACTGEMHKLAILQASIEYIRYLHDCVERLKKSREGQVSETSTDISGITRESCSPDQHFDHLESCSEDQHSPDVEMANSETAPSPSPTPTPRCLSSSSTTSRQSSVSPANMALDTCHIDARVPVAEHHRHYSFSASATTSPAIVPQWGDTGYHSAAGSTLTSPALGPLRERDLDQEATAALLMLNTDRRGTLSRITEATASTRGSGRVMSVKDLLSS